MSDSGGDGGGGGWFSGFRRGGMNTNIRIPGLEDAVRQIGDLNKAVAGLNTALGNLANQQATLGNNINKLIGGIGQQAQQAAQNVNQLGSAVGGLGSSGGGGGAGGGSIIGRIFAGAASSDILKDLAMFPLRFITQTTGLNRQLAMNVSAALGGQQWATGASSSDIMSVLSRFPGNVQGTPEELINLVGLSRQAGGFLDFSRINIANRGGGAIAQDPQFSARTAGFLTAVSQAQMMTPGVGAGQIGQTIGGFLASPQAQQQSAFYTGGAFSMVAAGGRTRTLQEWAESILRWMEGMRPGDMRGKPFTYGELMAQYFPGSNMDAWLTVNGVPEGMKEYFWTYAIGKAQRVGSTQGRNQLNTGGSAAVGISGDFQIQPVNTGPGGQGNQAWERLRATSAQTRGQFRLGAQMAGAYTNTETANRWFNELLAQITGELIPRQVAQGSLAALQYMPDTMTELLMSFLERSGPLGAMIGGGLGYGIQGGQSLLKNLMGFLTTGGEGDIGGQTLPGLTGQGLSTIMDIFGGGLQAGGGLASQIAEALKGIIPGDTPDYGDMEWGQYGNNSMTGLHPDMRKKLGRMMQANPKLRINSGLRDTVTQQNLRSKGHNQVSGKPSAHTRGLAADLGPRSQYNWIVTNARKFGLRSGNNVGEPWHVGLGDVEMPYTYGRGFGIGDDEDYFDRALQDAKNALSRQNTFGMAEVEVQLAAQQSNYGFNDDNARRLRGLLVAWAKTQAGWNAGPAPVTYDPYTGTFSGGTPTAADPNAPYNAFTDPTPRTAPAGAEGTAVSGLGALFGLLSGNLKKEDVIGSIGGLVPGIMNLFFGLFGMGQATQAQMDEKLAYDPFLYSALRAKGQYFTGGVQASSATSQGYTFGASFASMARQSGIGQFDQGAPSQGSGAYGFGEPKSRESGIAAAKVLFNAGFKTRADLEKIVAISWRESGWNPGSKNENTSDRGLMQINMSAHRHTMERYGYDEADLMDAQKNANIAYGLWSAGGGNYASFQQLWGFSTHSPYVPGGVGWDKHGDPLGRTEGSNASDIVAAANIPGLGDVGEMFMQAPQRSAPIVFDNKFNITIQGTGGSPASGGIDARRAATVLADHLEEEMKRRMVRYN